MAAEPNQPNQQKRQTHQPPPPSTPYGTTLLFDMENGRKLPEVKRQDIVITSELARVLARAAQTNSGVTGEPPLSFSSLLVAMLVDENTWLRDHLTAQAASFDAIARKRPYDEKSLRFLGEGNLGREYLTSTSAHQAFDEAARILAKTSPGAPLDTRHLCAAYPVLAGWHLEDFASFEIDRLEWARAFASEMVRRFRTEKEYWRAYADRAAPVPLTSFSADVYTKEDLLGIDRSVEALALLIASTRTSTPLAIGVFGPWGSGKTFFMSHLRERIVAVGKREQPRIDEWTARRVDKSATEAVPLYFADIAQVEFNAWHYNEGNLVASLVEHLFRNLRVRPDEEDRDLAERRKKMLGKLKVLQSDLTTVDQAIAEAESKLEGAKQKVQRASERVAEANRDVDSKTRAIAARNADLEAERQRLDLAIQAVDLAPGKVDAKAILEVALEPFKPLLGQVEKAKQEAFEWKDFFAGVFSAKGLLVVGICVVTPLVLLAVHAIQKELATLVGTLLASFAGLGKAVDVLKQGRARFEKTLSDVEKEARAGIEEARKGLEAERDRLDAGAKTQMEALSATLAAGRAALAQREAELSRAAEDLARGVKEHEARMADRLEREAEVRTAEAEYNRISSALLLEEFIADRASTDEYRKQLGFLALVRRDIDRLSRLIDDANKKWLSPGNTDPAPVLNRIVLYIDDLDRCKESTVLAVLEAVHLLLAFPLFVCAVAVDPRWIEKCLREKHEHLFAAESEDESAPATVGDYLEKIFQIPMWMSPILATTRATLVNTMLGTTAAPAARVVVSARGGNGHAGPSGNGAGAAPDAFKALVAKAKASPDPLRIEPEEGKYVEQIAELLSDRPRALKRFVNVYRLLKASLPDVDRATFVSKEPSSCHRICLAQLALFTSHPRLAPALVRELEAPVAEPPAEGTSLQQWFDALPEARRTRLAPVFALVPDCESTPLEKFKEWLPLTSRYLFHRAE